MHELLRDSELSALLVIAAGASDPDVAPFVGDAHLGSCFLLVRVAGTPRLGFLTEMERAEAAATGLKTLSPAALELDVLRRDTGSEAELWAAILERSLAAAGIEPGAVGLAGHFPAGVVHAACTRLARSGWSFQPAHELLRALRQAKCDDELGEIRRAASAACAAMRRVARMLATGDRSLTAGDLRAEIARVFAEHGVQQPEGNIVAYGVDAAIPHSRGADATPIGEGRALVVDLFPAGRLFADCTRTFCLGEPPPELARAHLAVVETLEAARRAVDPGVRGFALQELACERLEAAGYATPLSEPGTTTGYVHGLGHGVGYELHEYPTFRSREGASGELGVGDVFTLEPGLYDPSAGWGVRVEDLCHLSAAGLEVLTPLPYDLDPHAWG